MDNFLHTADFADLRSLVNNTVSLKGVIKVGSMFSGWGVLEMVLKVLQHKWNENDLNTPMQAFQFVLSIYRYPLGLLL